MSDVQSKRAAGKADASAADEYREISYFAWKRGVDAPRPEAARAAPASPAAGPRLFWP